MVRRAGLGRSVTQSPPAHFCKTKKRVREIHFHKTKIATITVTNFVVRRAGLEPAQLIQPRDFKSLVSTNSTIRAWIDLTIILYKSIFCQYILEAPARIELAFTVLQTAA